MTVARSADPLALYAYAGPLDGDPPLDPPLSSTNQMILQSNFSAENIYGYCRCGPANVYLWRDPVTGSGVLLTAGEEPTVRFFDGTGATTMYPPLAGTLRDKDGVAITTPAYMPMQPITKDESTSFFWAVEGGTITIWNVQNDHTVTRWTADLTAYISGEGGPAYALWQDPEELLRIEHIALLRAPYIELRGMEDGWYAMTVRKYFDAANRLEYDEVWYAVPAVDGIARIYPDSIDRIDRYYNVIDSDPHERQDHETFPLIISFDAAGSNGIGIITTIRFGDVWHFAAEGVDPDDDEDTEEPTPTEVPLPAYRPGPFTMPLTEGQVLDTTDLITVAWTAHVPAHPQGLSVQYYAEYSQDGGVTWALLHDWQGSTSFDWDHSEYDFTRMGKIRVKAKGTNGLESGWRESPSFVLYHFAGVEVLKGRAHDRLIASVSKHSVYLQVAYQDTLPGHRDTHWEIWDDPEDPEESVKLYDEIVAGADRFRHWVTGLTEATSYRVRYSFIDYLDNEGEMSEWMDFRTLRLVIYKPIHAKDEMGNVDARYTLAGYPFGETIEVGGQPEVSAALRWRTTEDRISQRLNAIGKDLIGQEVAPEPNGHVMRLSDPVLQRFKGGGHRNAWTAMLITIPLNLAVHAEVMGQPTDNFVYFRAGGDLYFAVRNATSSNVVIPYARTLVEGQQHAIFCGQADGWYNLVGGKPVPKAPETQVRKAEVWTGLDGTWEMSGTLGTEIGAGDAFSHTHDEMFDVGHGSSNFANNEDIWANGRYSEQLVLCFAYWTVVLSSDHVANLAALQDDAQALADYISEMDTPPLAFLRADEFPPPSKPNLLDT